MKKHLLLLLLLPLMASAADYGQKVKFAEGKTLAFPDCELVFLGERKVSHPVFKPGFVYYDFKARVSGITKDVIWSAGTGLIAPAAFEVDGKKFLLELKGSRAFKGWLKDNELVLWRDDIKR